MARLAITLVLSLLASGVVRAASPAENPRLVLVIIVDQLRRDRLDPGLPGGLGRLAREGRVYADAALAHALTETCSGYVTLLSGRHPGHAGVPGNRFIDRETGTRRYCVGDPAADARVIGGSDGRSPRLIRVDGLGDWLKAAQPEARVYSVAGKDRAAIAMGGRRPDASYWTLRPGPFAFTTSLYYQKRLPDWVSRWNAGGVAGGSPLARIPATWQHELIGLNADGTLGPDRRIDDYRAESPSDGRTSGHRLADDDPEVFGERVHISPFLDELTLDFALALVRNEQLGSRDVPDLLALALSATDLIGHRYGPESHEAADALLRLDRALGRFLDSLEQELGSDRILIALSADHGVLPLPEWLAETGRGRCPVAGGRVGVRRLALGLGWFLHRSIGPLLSFPVSWLKIAGSQLTVDRQLAEERGVPVDRIVSLAERYLESHDAIAEAWTAREIAERSGPLAELYRNSFDPERSGDLAIEVEPGCLISPFDQGTGHGSPHAYDRDVPIVFFGPGIAPARVRGPAATVDIGPTLAHRLGVPLPPDLDGRNLID